jgi:hypothetical protein
MSVGLHVVSVGRQFAVPEAATVVRAVSKRIGGIVAAQEMVPAFVFAWYVGSECVESARRKTVNARI